MNLCVCGHTADEHGNDGTGSCGATRECRGGGCKAFRLDTSQRRAELHELALAYHKQVEGEYGCPGLECPGVKRLVVLLTAAAVLEREGALAALQVLTQATPKFTPSTRDAPGVTTVWALTMPFNKDGFPVAGNFGRSLRNVLVMDLQTWTKLCQDVPALGAMRFNVGTRE